MKLSNLIASREKILAQARLANLAFAYVTLKKLANVVQRGQLTGLVRLQQLDEKEERYWAMLTALSGNQSVVDEHFSDQDVADLADAVELTNPGVSLDVTFPIEDLGSVFVTPVEAELERAGVSVDGLGVQMPERAE